MIYRDFQGMKLSMLGFGAMRLPVIDGDDSRIDVEAAQRLIDEAMAAGINYYDTAWGYHGGNSEPFVGKALAKYPRDSYCVATKFPGYDLRNIPKVKRIFEEQLRKTGLEYFDFYLFHNVCEMNVDAYLNPKYGVMDYLREQKKSGRIRHLGFSCHGELDVLKRFLDAYGDEMEFCQLQINYFDWYFQHGKEKAELLAARGIPLWIMEPLRGGRLVKLDAVSEEELKALRPDEEIREWAFRFLQTVPGVTVVLSGMSDETQLAGNVKTFSEEKPLNDEEFAAITRVARRIEAQKSVPCTACHYCVSHCPQGLDIPHLIELYNEHMLTVAGGHMAFIAPMALAAIPEGERPAACLHCQSCEQVCPQQIPISEVMTSFVENIG